MKNLLLSFKILLCKLISTPITIIEIRDSKVKLIYGQKNNSFIKDCEDVARENNLNYGLIYITKNSNGKLIIKTSSDITKDSAQRLRNIWSFYS